MKLLVCAYSCLKDPDRRFGDGGEGVLGWNIVKQISLYNQVWVLTHSRNQEAIENKLAQEPIPGAKFQYFGLCRCLDFLNRFHGGIQIYAYLWQIKAYFVAKKLHKQVHFDIFHHVTYANDWMASYIGALLPVAYVRGPGGGAHRVPKNFLQGFSLKSHILENFRSLGQWLFRHDPIFILGHSKAESILVCNNEALNAIPEKWRDKARLFPVNGISNRDLSLLGSGEKSGDKFSVITAGKLIRIKNFDLAIRTFKMFNDKFKNSELTIVGQGPRFSYLNNLVQELGLQSSVHFEKWMPREELLSKMASSDVFLFPSLRDGGGAVVVEAMAAGKPIVCLDIGGPGFHINEQYGVKVKPESPDQVVTEMAKALERLYKDSDLRSRLGKNARQRAEEFYSWDKLGERLQGIYKEVNGSCVKTENKRKVLACVYACLKDPDRRFGDGGEGVLGWNIVKQISLYNQVWVLTHSRNQEAIENKLAQEPIPGAKFQYIKLSILLSPLQKFFGGIQIYAYLWQIKAYFVAKKLHKQVHFDIFHHVTYANDWMASYIGALLPVAYVRGPGGASPKIPKGFIDDYPLKDRFSEWFRSFGHLVSKCDPFYIIGQKKAKVILLCNNEALKTVSQKWKNKAQLFPVTGISSKELSFLDLNKKPKDNLNSKFSLVSAGKLMRIKGFDLAIRTFKMFNDKFKNSELTIVGSGPDDLYLNNLVQELGLQSSVHFEKWMPREELLSKMASSDVFLFPSLRDGGGAVVVEAMAAGKPIVCLDIGGPGFHINEQYGVKVKPESPDQVVTEMAKALERLYKDSDLRSRLGKNARQRAEEFYSWDKLGNRLATLYEKSTV